MLLSGSTAPSGALLATGAEAAEYCAHGAYDVTHRHACVRLELGGRQVLAFLEGRLVERAGNVNDIAYSRGV